MKKFLEQLQKDFPAIDFVAGSSFCWSPQNQRVIYKNSDSEVANWSILHELGHALLAHQSYQSDIELLLLEVAAWAKAKELGIIYGYQIDEDHIQDCIDSYRDWLDARSTCPECTSNGLQIDSRQYSCFNCQLRWQVTNSRFCRPYRLTKTSQKESRLETLLQTTFI